MDVNFISKIALTSKRCVLAFQDCAWEISKTVKTWHPETRRTPSLNLRMLITILAIRIMYSRKVFTSPMLRERTSDCLISEISAISVVLITKNHFNVELTQRTITIFVWLRLPRSFSLLTLLPAPSRQLLPTLPVKRLSSTMHLS